MDSAQEIPAKGRSHQQVGRMEDNSDQIAGQNHEAGNSGQDQNSDQDQDRDRRPDQDPDQDQDQVSDPDLDQDQVSNPDQDQDQDRPQEAAVDHIEGQSSQSGFRKVIATPESGRQEYQQSMKTTTTKTENHMVHQRKRQQESK